ncbi:Oxidoreductase [Pleurostoma richardsiae]|uniref:Oxidoreductase n=1 Tax=Pleurostoma richardsiae TaxID=41990 RepID=A0AA38RSS3_9PEZI|nr:Oxidoreductase [Pleurostoma richardsiae]
MSASSKTRVILLGAQHPHFYIRGGILKSREDVEVVGFWEADTKLVDKVAAKLSVQKFESVEELLKVPFDAAFVHTLDPENPRVARLAAAAGAKALLLEKPGATHPREIYALVEDLKTYPDLIVEWGWEMHYAEVMDVVRSLVRKDTLGQITTSHWHGGTPSGGGMELWQRQPGTLGGFLYMDGAHTIEAIVDVFGLPGRVCASIRKLPKGEKHKIVSCWYDMERDELDPSTEFAVGEMPYEDIGSVILEYETHNVVADFTAWEPTDWCVDWGINIYGTNGTFHGVLNPPVAEVMLREGKDGYKKGKTQMTTELDKGVTNQLGYYKKQIDLFLRRTRTGEKTESAGVEVQVPLMKIMEAIYASSREGKFKGIQ